MRLEDDAVRPQREDSEPQIRDNRTQNHETQELPGEFHHFIRSDSDEWTQCKPLGFAPHLQFIFLRKVPWETVSGWIIIAPSVTGKFS